MLTQNFTTAQRELSQSFSERYTPEQQDIIERSACNCGQFDDEPLPSYFPSLFRAAAWIIGILLVLAWVTK